MSNVENRHSIVLTNLHMIFVYLLKSKKNQRTGLSQNTTDFQGTSFLEIKLLANTFITLI